MSSLLDINGTIMSLWSEMLRVGLKRNLSFSHLREKKFKNPFSKLLKKSFSNFSKILFTFSRKYVNVYIIFANTTNLAKKKFCIISQTFARWGGDND
jgi:hypothetical protein